MAGFEGNVEIVFMMRGSSRLGVLEGDKMSVKNDWYFEVVIGVETYGKALKLTRGTDGSLGSVAAGSLL